MIRGPQVFRVVGRGQKDRMFDTIHTIQNIQHGRFIEFTNDGIQILHQHHDRDIGVDLPDSPNPVIEQFGIRELDHNAGSFDDIGHQQPDQ